jgi:hypothetical protein
MVETRYDKEAQMMFKLYTMPAILVKGGIHKKL